MRATTLIRKLGNAVEREGNDRVNVVVEREGVHAISDEVEVVAEDGMITICGKNGEFQEQPNEKFREVMRRVLGRGEIID